MENEDGQDFANNGGEALNLDGDFNDSDVGAEDQIRKDGSDGKAAGSGGKVDGEKLDN
jgi:hypothetical protein